MENKVYINARFLTQKTSGVQRFAIELCKRLNSINSNIVFLSPPNIFNKELALELNVKIIGKLSSHLWEQIELPLYLKSKGNPLLINFCNTAPIFYKNKIVTLHDIIFRLHPEWFSRLFSIWYNFLIPLITKKSKKILTVSNHAKKDINEHLYVSFDKIEVIYNSVCDDFKIDIPFKNIKKKYILSVSSLDPRKNFEKLILAYLNLGETEYDLVIVGSESKSFPKHELFNTIKSNTKIKFTGYITDKELVKYYKEASLFVYPSLYEGFGIPPLEAMACGTPVLVSNNSSLPEVCGHAAIYIDAENVENITMNIKNLLNNTILQSELIEKGFVRVNEFSWDESVAKLNQIIKSNNQ